MGFFAAFLTILIFGGCTTFSSREITKACKSGVKSYDDGQVQFDCFPKENKDD